MVRPEDAAYGGLIGGLFTGIAIFFIVLFPWVIYPIVGGAVASVIGYYLLKHW